MQIAKQICEPPFALLSVLKIAVGAFSPKAAIDAACL